ncbi:hypothetical protein LINPERHAP1_LOCUS40290 [Linum perenne]
MGTSDISSDDIGISLKRNFAQKSRISLTPESCRRNGTIPTWSLSQRQGTRSTCLSSDQLVAVTSDTKSSPKSSQTDSRSGLMILSRKPKQPLLEADQSMTTSSSCTRSYIASKIGTATEGRICA